MEAKREKNAETPHSGSETQAEVACFGSLDLLENILNGTDAFVYVTDPVNDDVLFVNEGATRRFKLNDISLGKKCWEVLQRGFKARCEFCPIRRLEREPDTPVVWEEHNSVTKRYYQNTDRYIDWVDGRKAHIQYSVDITDFKKTQFALDRRLRQQAFMISISQSFIHEADINAQLADTLRMTGIFLGVAGIALYLIGDGGISLVSKSMWTAPGLVELTQAGERIIIGERLRILAEELSHENRFNAGSYEPRLNDLLSPFRTHTLECRITPVYVKNELFGVLEFTKSDENEWFEGNSEMAAFLASLLSGVLDRHRLSEQLRRLSSIVERSPQFIMDMKLNGDISYVNPAAEAITGYTEAELRERGLSLVFDADTVKSIREEHIAKTLYSGTDSFETELVRKDGERRTLAFSGFTLGMLSENIGAIANDVTELRRLEADLTASRDAAEQGVRSKNEFLSRMSHEMRTPMNAIIGMTNIAMTTPDTEKKQYCLQRIGNASRHLLDVINDILDMSKIETNRFELSIADFSFEKMLNNVINAVNVNIEKRHQEFTLYIDPDIPSALIGDEQRLAQIITNLLTNANKFTPEKGMIELKATVFDEKDDLYTLVVEVSDSGIGISDEQQAKLFSSFEQVDGSIVRKFGGTGLGLAISKRIIELMGGSIWVDSEPGVGSCFKFSVKLRKGQLNTARPRRQLDLSKLNVMAVDDSPEVLEYFKHVMDKMGISCTVAPDGAGAIESFKRSARPFDIVFVDWQMPGMNGVELTRELLKLPGRYPIIIMISVAEWSDIKQEALEAGVMDFVPKPLFPSQLMDCIYRQMGALAEDEDEKEEAPTYNFKGKRALLAEDVEINREILVTIMEDTELVIECAENGREAVEKFAAAPDKFDLILMDVHMPEMDGMEAARRIRALEAQAPEKGRVPIVAMTANVFSEDIVSCLDAGMDDHIGKPIDNGELFQKMVKYLTDHESVKQA